MFEFLAMYGRDLVEVVVPISSQSSISPFASKEKLDVVSSISPFAAAKEGRLRHQPDSALALWFQDRVKCNGGRLRKTTIVALARKLLVALWKYAGRVSVYATLRIPVMRQDTKPQSYPTSGLEAPSSSYVGNWVTG